jgi:hypothetical protein
MIAAAALAIVLAQKPEAPPDVTVMKAALGGSCSAEFTVKDGAGKPVYGANVHVRVRYGFAGVKRADLDVGTSSSGKARIEGLPDKARPMIYEIGKDEKKTDVTQDVAEKCNATFEVTLK